MTIVKTERLLLRRIVDDDAAFILELLTDPAFVRFVGDRGVSTLDEARQYIADGPTVSYETHGFGLYLVEEIASGLPTGICGLLKRDALDDVDIGFAFMPGFRGRGYATESAAAVLEFGFDTLGLKRIVAITSPDNAGSGKVLEKIGLSFEAMVSLAGGTSDVCLFAAGKGTIEQV